MTPTELLETVRRIEVRTNRLVNDMMVGAYLSHFKGRGMDFEELREYIPGDDVRDIDWNVTHRMGRPFVKRFREERELAAVLAVDVSASSAFGSGNRTKREFAAEVAATLLIGYTSLLLYDIAQSRRALVLEAETLCDIVADRTAYALVFRDADAARRALEDGCEIQVFCDPAAALEHLLSAPLPDILVLDWIMPGISSTWRSPGRSTS